MESSGILEFFETVTTSEEAGVKKPHPMIFRTALEKSAANTVKSVMIGDNLEADIVGAHEFGLNVIYLNPIPDKSQTQFPQIQKLKELFDYL